eukprot:4571191-Pyramimonas_sp.AAC.1
MSCCESALRSRRRRRGGGASDSRKIWHVEGRGGMGDASSRGASRVVLDGSFLAGVRPRIVARVVCHGLSLGMLSLH